ncbi:hypothetical protein FS764_22785 [Agrobacterium vitis]|uniref:hypothetical protein n=1 Tax=Agrobacterium vitis TaxID=373 RepID=UPI001F34BE23|nr:hypothetical protein [Agrobacterium vitis]MCF1469708.1 hypothetical protein [Agrobacterium vitis]
MLSHLRLEGKKRIRTVISMIVRIRRGHSKGRILRLHLGVMHRIRTDCYLGAYLAVKSHVFRILGHPVSTDPEVETINA